MLKILRQILLLGLIAISTVFADRPAVVIRIRNIESINTLMLDSFIVWNLPDLDVGKLGEIYTSSSEYIVHGNKATFSKEYSRNGIIYKIDVVFPEQLSGRELNDSSRAEVKITQDERVVFYSKYFGQNSSEYSDSKLRPLSVVINNLDQLIIKGSLAEREVDRDKIHIDGYTLEDLDVANGPIDDEEMIKRVIPPQNINNK